MGTRTTLCLLAVCLVGAGCSVVATGTRVVSARVKESISDCAEQVRNKAWARDAWRDVRAANPGVAYSGDHEKGFEAGFTEHLYRGATQPPPLPPASYRGPSHQTPQGYQSILAWFDGFRHGVAEAQARGARDIVTGPSSLRQSVPATDLIAPPDAPPPPLPPAPPALPVPQAAPAENGMARGGRFVRP